MGLRWLRWGLLGELVMVIICVGDCVTITHDAVTPDHSSFTRLLITAHTTPVRADKDSV